MAFVVKDRVRETTTTTGTGTISLGGAVSGYQAFSTIGDGNTTYYTIVGGTQWEVGVGTYASSGNTLARTTLISSSTGSAIDFAAGSKDVFIGQPADKIVTNEIGTLAVAHGGTGQTSFPAAGLVVSTGSTWDTSKTAPTGALVGTTDTQSLTNKTITAIANFETKTTTSANAINLANGNYFTHTLSGNTSLTVSNTPSTGTAASFILEMTNGGSATITWWSGMKWAGGTAPTLTAAGKDILGFYTYDGGTTWNGLVLAKDVK